VASEPRDLTRAAIAKAEAEIEQARATVAAQVGRLQQEVAETLDWRHWVRRHPTAFLAGALGLGYLIGRRP
jgi:hypothetical protein